MTFADHLRTHQDAHNGGGEMPISYGSVCSGIEAASVAWHHLGWIPRWFAEIEPFPSAVLAHHWPEVSNLGDFTAIRDKIAEGAVEAPDVLVGGTPCQAFSVAGLRQSLDDKRGQLTLEFVRLADAIDSARSFRGQRPVTVVWENVPGVLNTPDNAFGCFLAGLVGEDDPLVPPGGRWTNVGYVRGPKRAVVWRILDAQYFGVAQRRRRVFVVASAGGISPESVLFELEGVRRDSPPSRQAGQGIAHDVARRTGERSHWDGGPHPSLNQSNNIGGVGMSNQEIFSQRGAYLAPHPVAPCLQAGGKAAGSATQQDAESGALVVEPRAWAIQERAAHPNLNAGPGGKGYQEGVAYTLEARHHVQACAVTGDVFHTLRAEGHDASEDGTGRSAGAVAVAFTSKDYGADASEGLAPTMRSMGHNESRANGGGQLAVAVGFNARQDPDSWVGRTGPLDTDGGTQAVAFSSKDYGADAGEIAPTMRSMGHDRSHANGGGQLAVAYGVAESPDLAHCLRSGASKADKHESTTYVQTAMQVRRLTPTEAERLQGFPDGHTLIPWRGKPAEDCPDGPRYKALGNSMAVPVMRWIGARIARQLEAQA